MLESRRLFVNRRTAWLVLHLGVGFGIQVFALEKDSTMTSNKSVAQQAETSHLETHQDSRLTEERELICSYPKSGRTWIRYTLAQALMRHYGIPVKSDFLSAYEVIPSDESKSLFYPEPAFPFKYEGVVPKIAVTHAPYSEEMHGRTNSLFIVRDPRSVIVSHFLHLRHHEGYTGSIPDFIREPELGVHGILSYLKGWVPHLNPDQVVTYENMKAEPLQNITRIVDHLRLPIPASTIREAIAASTFDRMQQEEVTRGLPQVSASSAPDARRVRSGTPSGYTNYLSPEDTDFIHTAIESSDFAVRALLAQTGYPIRVKK